jgi:hypothetical protein
MSRRKSALLSVFLTATTAWASVSRGVAVRTTSLGAVVSGAQNHAPYPDSAQGLKRQLKDMLELARSHKSDQLRVMIKDLEFPDARAWYLANFGTPGLQPADYYKKNLSESQSRFENEILVFAHQDGYFSVKKQNAKKVFPALIADPEIFLAAWELGYGQDHDETPLGYFVFVDGKFRWDSSTTWISLD